MAKISFGKKDATGPSVSKKEKVEEKEPVEVQTEVGESEPVEKTEEPTTTAVAKRDSGDIGFTDDDEGGMEEIILPRMNFVQKVGPLSEEFTPGEIVLNKELVIYAPEKDNSQTPLEITVLGFRPTQWTERIDGGALGRLFSSAREVAEAGGTTDYNVWKDSYDDKDKDEIPYFQQLATALILIKRPEGVDEEETYFPYPFGDDYYAIAQWSMKGAAFTNGAKVIKTARKIGHLRRGGLSSYSFRLDTKTKKYGTNHYAVIPVLKPGSKHPEDFLAFAKGILGGEEDSKGNID